MHAPHWLHAHNSVRVGRDIPSNTLGHMRGPFKDTRQITGSACQEKQQYFHPRSSTANLEKSSAFPLRRDQNKAQMRTIKTWPIFPQVCGAQRLVLPGKFCPGKRLSGVAYAGTLQREGWARVTDISRIYQAEVDTMEGS